MPNISINELSHTISELIDLDLEHQSLIESAVNRALAAKDIIGGGAYGYPKPIINGKIINPHPIINGTVINPHPPIINGVLINPCPVINGTVINPHPPIINGIIIKHEDDRS